MSDTDFDHDDLRQSKSKESTSSTELSTDGAVSLFSTILTNALEKQKVILINHFESHFLQPVKSTGVSTPHFVFKREEHRIQYLFNTERSDTISGIEKLINSKSYVQALDVLAEKKETMRTRNKFLKSATNMDGTPSMNTLIVLWLTIRTMQLICVPLLPVHPGKGKVQNRMTG
ncbi:unnamed protein product [Mytilus coruscus]|uniref:Uncharacterized protein n=1 Tax=Mytilus coruscus TaxID=42192 RepID=A0A6J8E527_MYTCO|nr:unnamed protein product [Mytilus coruscus]